MKAINVLFIIVLLSLPFEIANAIEVYELGGNRYSTKEASVEADVDQGSTIVIKAATHLSGKLYITSTESGKAKFDYKKILKTESSSKAADYSAIIEVDMQKTTSGLNILLRAPNPAPWSETNDAGIVEGDLTLPAGCNLEIDAVYFDLVIDGPFSSVTNEKSFGRIDVQNINDMVDLSTNSRDISLNGVKGEISLNTNNADIRIKDMVTNFDPARLKNENGNIFIDNAVGAFIIRNDYGKIRMDNINFVGDNSRIIGSHCPINVDILDMGEGYLAITDTDEDVSLTVPSSISANFSLEVEGDGEIHSKGIAVEPTQITRSRIEMKSGNGDAQIMIDLKGGADIEIEGKP